MNPGDTAVPGPTGRDAGPAGVSPFEDVAVLARATKILQKGYERYLAARQEVERGEVDPDEAA